MANDDAGFPTSRELLGLPPETEEEELIRLIRRQDWLAAYRDQTRKYHQRRNNHARQERVRLGEYYKVVEAQQRQRKERERRMRENAGMK